MSVCLVRTEILFMRFGHENISLVTFILSISLRNGFQVMARERVSVLLDCL